MSTALMLGGGGPLGMAWELGVLSGVTSNGSNLSDIDLVVGTSAGSAVGAWLRSGNVSGDEFFKRLQTANAELRGLMGKLMAENPRPVKARPR